jgi:hypothetical protein
MMVAWHEMPGIRGKGKPVRYEELFLASILVGLCKLLAERQVPGQSIIPRPTGRDSFF